MLELPINHQGTGESVQLRPDMPLHVIIAFDQLTVDEQRAVLMALETLERDGLSGAAASLNLTRLAGARSLYSLPAAPDVRVLIRAEPDAPVEVVDIIRPAALRGFAYAAG